MMPDALAHNIGQAMETAPRHAIYLGEDGRWFVFLTDHTSPLSYHGSHDEATAERIRLDRIARGEAALGVLRAVAERAET